MPLATEAGTRHQQYLSLLRERAAEGLEIRHMRQPDERAYASMRACPLHAFRVVVHPALQYLQVLLCGLMLIEVTTRPAERHYA